MPLHHAPCKRDNRLERLVSAMSNRKESISAYCIVFQQELCLLVTEGFPLLPTDCWETQRRAPLVHVVCNPDRDMQELTHDHYLPSVSGLMQN